MSDEEKIAAHRAGHAERMAIAEAKVAQNLQEAKDREAAEAEREAAWCALSARAELVGCRLQKCHLSPTCEGDCGCGPGLLVVRDDVQAFEQIIIALEIEVVT